MRSLFIFALFLMFAGIVSAAECSETLSRTMEVPSINDLGLGQMVEIKLKIEPGDGTTYVATAPVVGSLTQVSGQTATQVATQITGYNRESCDFLLKIGEGDLTNIDGPSAGAAMALLILSALENSSIRDNMTITGTIEANGLVGPVGGVPAKAMAASAEGFNVIITPYLGIDDRITIDALGDRIGVEIAQVRDIEQVKQIAYNTNNTTFAGPSFSFEEIPNIPAFGGLDNPRFNHFKNIGEEIINQARAEASVLNNEDYREYFNNQLDIAKNALDQGYHYTGANTAFITLINIGFLKDSDADREEIDRRINNIERCYQEAVEAKPKKDNWEWIIGGQLRASWAKRKIEGINNDSFSNDIRRLNALKELVYAESWCTASRNLLAAEGEGEELGAEVFKRVAVETVDAAEEYLSGRKEQFPDQNWHLETAKTEFDNGLYGAAVYDATYALFMVKGHDSIYLQGKTPEDITGEYNGKRYTSIWANLYRSQSKYIEEHEGPGEVTAQLSEFSNGLENRTDAMKREIGDVKSDMVLEALSLIFITLLFVMLSLAVIIKRKLMG